MVVELIDYVRVLQRRWVVVAVATLLGLAAGFFTASEAGDEPVSYTATQTLSVVQPSATATAPVVSFSPSQLAVYATVGDVPREAAEALSYPGTPQELASGITAEPDDAVGVLRITATDVDGARAAEIANTFGRKLRTVIIADAQRQLRTEIELADRRADVLQRQTTNLDAQIAGAPANVAVLTARRDALINQYRIAYDELQALQERTTSGDPVIILENAIPERATGGLTAPKSRPARMAIFGFLGLLLGAALALVLDRIDTRIRTKDDAEEATGLPVLAEIPFLPRRFRHELISATRPASPFAEAYRNLRSSLVFARGPLAAAPDDADPDTTPIRRPVDHEPTVMLVTSAGPYEGKTTTVANLAASYAETDHSVLILDCDFRRPRLHQVFGTRESPGLADALEDPRRFGSDNEVLCATSVDDVRLVPAGNPTDNPARLFNRARTLIEASRQQADIVLIDTPPYLVANDAAELIPWVDAILITVKSRRTSRGPIERMVESLSRLQAPVVGVLLIGTDDAGSGYSPYYYHRAAARTAKARRRWRRALRLGPPKDKGAAPSGVEEPVPEPQLEDLVTAAGAPIVNENGSRPPPQVDTDADTDTVSATDTDTDTDAEADTATDADTDTDAEADTDRRRRRHRHRHRHRRCRRRGPVGRAAGDRPEVDRRALLHAGTVELDHRPVTDVDAAVAPDDIDVGFVPRLSSDLVALEVAADTVLLGGFGQALVLNPTAGLVWRFLDGETALGDLIEDFSDVLDVDADTVRRDIVDFARALGRTGLLEGVVEPIDPEHRVDVDWSPPEPVAVGDMPDSVALTDLDGVPATLEAWRGRRVFLVNWSPGCGFCVTTAAALAAAEEGLAAAGIDLVLLTTGDPDENRRVLSESGLGAPAFLRADEGDPFAGFGTPSAYLLDGDGRVEEPMAYGAHEVPARAAELAGIDLPGPGDPAITARGADGGQRPGRALPPRRQRGLRTRGRRRGWVERDAVGRHRRLPGRGLPHRGPVQRPGDGGDPRPAAARRPGAGRSDPGQLLGRPLPRGRRRLPAAEPARPGRPTARPEPIGGPGPRRPAGLRVRRHDAPRRRSPAPRRHRGGGRRRGAAPAAGPGELDQADPDHAGPTRHRPRRRALRHHRPRIR